MIRKTTTTRRICLLLMGLLAHTFSAFSSSGCRLEIQLENYKMKQLYFARYLGGEFHYMDTIQRNEDGLFIKRDTQPLEAGIYTVVLKPKRNAIQVLVDHNNQHWQLMAHADSIRADKIQFEGSALNTAFYDYLVNLSDKRKAINELYTKLAQSEGKVKKKLQKYIDKKQKELRSYQQSVAAKHPGTWLELSAWTDLEKPMPKFKGTDEETNLLRYEFRRSHFFDEMKLSDPRHVHNPRYFNKINFYVSRLVPQHRDSVGPNIEKLLQVLENTNTKLFQSTLDYFIRLYEKPRIVGMDAVYVYLANRYHNQGKTSWLDEKRLKAIQKNVRTFERILIGKTAPDIKVQKRSGEAISLYDIQSDFTILFFWRPGCGHCKKAAPKLKALYEKYQGQSVEILSVCTHLGAKVGECWTYIDENELDLWVNAVDPRHQSKFLRLYNAQRTPKIYVLDKEKKILIKDIAANQLDQLMERFMKESASASKS
ncbi:MAG: redoxin domain-containing protein [Bacteroidota bacterium]